MNYSKHIIQQHFSVLLFMLLFCSIDTLHAADSIHTEIQQDTANQQSEQEETKVAENVIRVFVIELEEADQTVYYKILKKSGVKVIEEQKHVSGKELRIDINELDEGIYRLVYETPNKSDQLQFIR